MHFTDRPEFRAWLARRDAQGFAAQRHGDRKSNRPTDDSCQGCGDPLGDTPSQLEEECLPCLAERFGGDRVEAGLAKVLIGGLVKAAMKTDELSDELVVKSVTDALREYEYETGAASGRSMARAA